MSPELPKATIDAVGLIPGARGAGTLARRIGNNRGFRGSVADTYGASKIAKAKGQMTATSAAYNILESDAGGLLLDALGSLPAISTAVSAVNIGMTGYETYKKVETCRVQ